MPRGNDTASDVSDSEEFLLRRIEAVEENVFSQMLEFLQEDGAEDNNERLIIQSQDKENLRALILEEFTRALASRESESSQIKLTGTTQDSSERLPSDVYSVANHQLILPTNGYQGSPSPSQGTTSQLSLEQAIAGLWPELHRSLASRPQHQHR